MSKLALKKLTASDLTLFEWHFRNRNAGNQKAINLNADVFVQQLFPALPEVGGSVSLEMPQPLMKAMIRQTADPQPCPNTLPAGYAAFTRPSGSLQLCQGGMGQNSWYGNGQVNALNAVTHTSGR